MLCGRDTGGLIQRCSTGRTRTHDEELVCFPLVDLQGNREVNMHTNPAQDASSSALYSRHAAYLHSSGVSRDQNSKQQGSQSAQLVAHLANVAAGKAQYPVGAGA